VYIVRFGGDPDEFRARQEAERLRLRARYMRHLVATADVDEATAERVIAVLFDHLTTDGRPCPCSCHPRLSDQHDDGFDCSCSWDEARRAERSRTWGQRLDDADVEVLREHYASEEAAIARWLAGQTAVTAERTTSYAPEQWTGTVDGHTFYFRERGGFWRIELDLEPNGRFAERVVDVRDGEFITEPEPILEGTVVAEGVDSQLGTTPVDHLAFIVTTIRDHLWERECDHTGALLFCPKCGQRR
jgi:hypothetical protein